MQFCNLMLLPTITRVSISVSKSHCQLFIRAIGMRWLICHSTSKITLQTMCSCTYSCHDTQCKPANPSDYPNSSFFQR